MRISKSIAAMLACLLIVLTIMGGCSNSTPAETTHPTVAPTEPAPTEPAPTEPDGYRIAKDAYNGSEITEFTVGVVESTEAPTEPVPTEPSVEPAPQETGFIAWIKNLIAMIIDFFTNLFR